MRAEGHAIGARRAAQNIRARQRVQAADVIGFAHAALRGDFGNAGLGKLGIKLAQQRHQLVRILAHAALRLRQLGAIRRVRCRAGDIDTDQILLHGAVEPRAAELRHVLALLGQLLQRVINAHVLGLPVQAGMVDMIAQKRRGHIHIAQQKAQAHGLHAARAHLHGHARAAAHQAVARRVDHRTGSQRLQAVLAFDEHMGDAAVRHLAGGYHGVGIQLYPGFQHHALGQQLVIFGIEGYMALGQLHLACAGGHQALNKLPADAAQHALALVIAAADRIHQPGRGRAAQVAHFFNQRGAAAIARGADGRHPACRAAAAHHGVVLRNHGRLPLDCQLIHTKKHLRNKICFIIAH